MKRLTTLTLLTLAASALAAAQQVCRLDTIRGTYAISVSGWTTIVQPPMTVFGTILGVVSIDWDGKISGAGAVSGLGPVTDYEVAGTAKIGPECTGTLTMKVRPKGTAQYIGIETDRFVLDPDGKTLLTTVVDMGPGYYPSMLGVWKRISREPNAASW